MRFKSMGIARIYCTNVLHKLTDFQFVQHSCSINFLLSEWQSYCSLIAPEGKCCSIVLLNSSILITPLCNTCMQLLHERAIVLLNSSILITPLCNTCMQQLQVRAIVLLNNKVLINCVAWSCNTKNCQCERALKLLIWTSKNANALLCRYTDFYVFTYLLCVCKFNKINPIYTLKFCKNLVIHKLRAGPNKNVCGPCRAGNFGPISISSEYHRFSGRILICILNC